MRRLRFPGAQRIALSQLLTIKYGAMVTVEFNEAFQVLTGRINVGIAIKFIKEELGALAFNFKQSLYRSQQSRFVFRKEDVPSHEKESK
jgi:hypothetical protein